MVPIETIVVATVVVVSSSNEQWALIYDLCVCVYVLDS